MVNEMKFNINWFRKTLFFNVTSRSAGVFFFWGTKIQKKDSFFVQKALSTKINFGNHAAVRNLGQIQFEEKPI